MGKLSFSSLKMQQLKNDSTFLFKFIAESSQKHSVKLKILNWHSAPLKIFIFFNTILRRHRNALNTKKIKSHFCFCFRNKRKKKTGKEQRTNEGWTQNKQRIQHRKWGERGERQTKTKKLESYRKRQKRLNNISREDLLW